MCADGPRGHLFVIHGDLTRLHCDGLLVPKDDRGNVSAWWEPVLGETRTGDESGWLKRVDSGNEFSTPREHPDGETQVVLVDTVGGNPSGRDLLDRALKGLDSLLGRTKEWGDREVPLFALPMLGTGEGVHRERRNEVMKELVRGLSEWCHENGVDVAFVLKTRSAYVATQAVRKEIGDRLWADLAEIDSGASLSAADDLGARAAAEELSMFVGAGVSVPLGLPTWSGLLDDLATRANIPEQDRLDDYLRYAAQIEEGLGRAELEKEMASRFRLDRHALGHSLLMGLGHRETVTTNYDNALELALAGRDQEVAVLTRQEAMGDRPWILKIHGDVTHPESIVLSAGDYEKLKDWGGALYGIVQSLLMTSHVLFVGFGFEDPDFQDLLADVDRARQKVLDQGSMRTPATALALTSDSAAAYPSVFERVSMLGEGEGDRLSRAARRLEIFLDRVAFTAATQSSTAAEYLLDPDYEIGASAADQALATRLRDLAQTPEIKGSVAWPQVEDLLKRLGYRPRH